MVNNGFDVEAKSWTDHACVFSVHFQNNRRLPRIIESTTNTVPNHQVREMCIYRSEESLQDCYCDIHHENTHLLLLLLDFPNDA